MSTMELPARRVTRSSTTSEDEALQGKVAGNAGKNFTRRLFGAQKINSTTGAAPQPKAAVVSKPVATAKPRAKKAMVPAAPIVRAAHLHPEVEGMDRELFCVEFCDDAFEYMLHSQRQFTMEEGFMDGKTVTPKMRSILVDWLVQVHQRFHLLAETLHLTVYLVDCMLAEGDVDKTELQLVGVTCMLVASKYEEMYAPEIKDFEYITDNAFTKKQILQMELRVMRSCDYLLARPHTLTFLRTINSKFDSSAKIHHLSKYLAELALVDNSMTHVLPSIIACTAAVLAHELTNTEVDVKQLCSIVHLSVAEMKQYLPMLARLVVRLHNQKKLVALKTKFAPPKVCSVSTMSEEQLAILTAMI